LAGRRDNDFRKNGHRCLPFILLAPIASAQTGNDLFKPMLGYCFVIFHNPSSSAILFSARDQMNPHLSGLFFPMEIRPNVRAIHRKRYN
jgi:hypothetical protein